MDPTSPSRQYTIRAEPHGPHWVAWIADSAGNPEQSIVLIGKDREEVEEKARRWLDECRPGSPT